jgi:hypothetical protein
MAVLWAETDPWGDRIALTDERWQHILNEHPDMKDHQGELRETIRQPNFVFQDEDVAEKHYFYRLFGGRYLLAVIIKTAASFIVTAHFVRLPQKGGRLKWFKR